MSLVVGIDPGVARMGYGLVEERSDRSWVFHDCGVLVTDRHLDLPTRLRIIHDDLQEMFGADPPTELAMEQQFYGRNSSTAFAVGQATGVVMLAAAQAGMSVHLYKPNEIKLSIAGTGRADKRQMQEMVTMMLRLSAVPQPDDAADGLAVALCHLQRRGYQALIHDPRAANSA